MYNFDNITALGESAGSIIKDMSQYGNNGTVNGATWTGNGKRGGAYTFNGSSSYISIPSYAFSTNNTISAWIDFTNVNDTRYFLGNDTNSNGIRYNGSTLLIYAGNDNAALTWNKINGFVHFVVARTTAQDYKIFINGEYLGTISLPSG
jgi:hypothetical protein